MISLHRMENLGNPRMVPRLKLLHWIRLAEQVMKHGRVNAERWELVS